MALNAAQLARRAGTLGGSDIGCLMTGDIAKIHRLWREKIGEELPEDLSDVWPVQLGITTEQLNLDWYARKHKQDVSRRGDVITHPFYEWAAVTIDGWVDTLQCPIECKHVGGREPLEVLLSRWAPQLQWQCECSGSDQVAVSIILAASEPIIEFIERDAAYAAILIERGELFMQHVRNRTPPVNLPQVPSPIDADKIYDMSNDEKWQRYAASWLQTVGAMETAKEAEKSLKALVPVDAKRCIGGGVYISRDRAGRLSLRQE